MKRKPNWKVVIFSLIALAFFPLTFFVDWMFIIGSVVFMLLGRRELGKRKGT